LKIRKLLLSDSDHEVLITALTEAAESFQSSANEAAATKDCIRYQRTANKIEALKERVQKL